MGSDRARVSYDPRQQYRSVVMQQGRVTLEADWNESQQITGEEIRSEALDLVGPSGTPDNGYNIVLTQSPTAPPYDFYVSDGTMYVGGIRAALLDPVQYSSQADWQDYGPEDPDWVDLNSLAQAPPTDEFIYLYLREQEVSAVEDPDLKDVALGGPDTAQRARLLQRIPRVRCSGTDCASGLDAAEGQWASEGLHFDPNTMRLDSWSTLSVGPADQPPAQTPCQPQAQGGYIDPDNQLIRVQISGVDPLTGNPKFLWGFDDASFLYRIQLYPNDPQNLILQSIPVDNYHQPVRGQAVEVLRTAAELPNGGCVAALSGFVFTLDQNYNPDSQSVVVPSSLSLPSDYVASNQSPALPLFLRVWQEEIVFTPGTAQTLGETGLAVTLQAIGGRPFHLGDYWLFAVRPATPQMVYPERYWNNLQQPDGPRQWACPLGVIAWSDQVGTLVSDCRNSFDNLVELSKRQQGCCTITVRPQDLSANVTLQSVVNKAANETMLVLAANPGSAGNNIQVEISNVQLNSIPPTFDLTVTETDIYLGQTTANIEGVIGDEEGGPNLGLAHILVGSVNPALVPLNNQTVTFTGGSANASAQVNVMDGSNQQIVFTLQARNSGIDGNLTTATVSNVDATGSPNSFALIVFWKKTLSGLNMGTLQKSIQTSLGYEITASGPTKVSPAFPIEGVTNLSGGSDGGPGVNPTYAQARVFGRPSTICLRPGSYRLPQTLVLGPEHSNITIESCGGNSTISAIAGNEASFASGLVQLSGAENITLRGLTFALPQVLLYQVGGTLGGLKSGSLSQIGESSLLSLNSSIGLMVSGCDALEIDGCTFNYPALQLNDLLFAAGILAGADCAGVKLNGNVFQGPAGINSMSSTTSGSTFSAALSAGYVQSDALQFVSPKLNSSAPIGSTGAYLPSSLRDILVKENTFQNLAFPVVISSVMGLGRFEGNRVQSCLTGFTIAPLDEVLQSQATVESSPNPQLDARERALSNAALQRMMSIAAVYPRPVVKVPHRVILLNPAEKVPVASERSDARMELLARVFTVSSVAATAPGSDTPSAAPGMPVAGGTIPTPAPAPAPQRFVKQPPLTTITSGLLKRLNQGANITNINSYFGLTFHISFLNNDVDAVVTGGGSLYSLMIVNQGPSSNASGTSGGTLILSNNRLQCASLLPSALVMVDVSAVTGNHIFNPFSSRFVKSSGISLLIDVQDPAGKNVAQTAVTGNVFIGAALLPPRPTQSPALPAWITYNLQL